MTQITDVGHKNTFLFWETASEETVNLCIKLAQVPSGLTL